MEELVLVQYIGRREYHTDALYDTGEWVKGQMKQVRIAVARKMFLHTDVYVPGEIKEEDAPGVEVIDSDSDKVEDRHQEEELVWSAKDAIMAMQTKDAVADYAFTNFQQKIPKNLSLENMKTQANMLIDQFGAA